MRYLLIPSCEVVSCDNLHDTMTEKRLVRGFQLWEHGNFDKIIVCGGVYLPPEVQKTPAGRLMRQWLLRKGLSADHVIVEDCSRDTFENISFSLLLLEDSAPKITVVTHWQQAIRFLLTFRLAHKMKVRTKPMYYSIGIKNFILEWVSLLIHLLDFSGTGIIARRNRKSRTYD